MLLSRIFNSNGSSTQHEFFSSGSYVYSTMQMEFSEVGSGFSSSITSLISKCAGVMEPTNATSNSLTILETLLLFLTPTPCYMLHVCMHVGIEIKMHDTLLVDDMQAKDCMHKAYA